MIAKHSRSVLPPMPSNNEKCGYGTTKLRKIASLFEVIHKLHDPAEVVVGERPLAMELVGQVCDYLYIFILSYFCLRQVIGFNPILSNLE